ncbi:hypothetical protein QE417_003063 [Mucilaginibacter terrae]|uniref:Uncharacterized protein n=1 Tax=Mucilaginibacter terrae TaxID=1955052 RepID=A0ABU3GWL0_9SPHI|nr:hypothetical protein [Mucilaginibacter terrae]
MRRELSEFSDRIDEQFELAAPNHTFALWAVILSWFS